MHGELHGDIVTQSLVQERCQVRQIAALGVCVIRDDNRRSGGNARQNVVVAHLAREQQVHRATMLENTAPGASADGHYGNGRAF